MTPDDHQARGEGRLSYVMKRECVIILGTFLGRFRIFGYLLGLFSDFWVSFLVKFDLFRNNPDFWVLTLIFNS